MNKFNNIHIEGHIGTWSCIDQTTHNGIDYYLMENNIYGEEAPCLIINDNKRVVLEDVYDGLSELEY